MHVIKFSSALYIQMFLIGDVGQVNTQLNMSCIHLHIFGYWQQVFAAQTFEIV
jgi:uncharacterized membrane protein